MRAELQCERPPSRPRLQDFVLSFIWSQHNSAESCSCVPAFELFISHFSTPNLLPCMSHCSELVAIFGLPHFPRLIDTFHIATKKKTKQRPSFSSLHLLLFVHFLYISCLFPLRLLSVCLLRSTYASQQSRFPFLRL